MKIETTCPKCQTTLNVEVADATYMVMGETYTGAELHEMYLRAVGLDEQPPQPIWPKDIGATEPTDGRTGKTPIEAPSIPRRVKNAR